MKDIVAVVEEIRYGCGASLTNVSSRCCVCIPPLDANYAVFSAISIPRPNVRFLRNRRTPDATISEVSYPQQVWRRSPTLIYMRPLLYPLPIPLPFFPPLWAFPLLLPLPPPFWTSHFPFPYSLPLLPFPPLSRGSGNEGGHMFYPRGPTLQ